MVQLELKHNEYGDEFGITIEGEYIKCNSKSELLKVIIDNI